jgi:hypothetical protein
MRRGGLVLIALATGLSFCLASRGMGADLVGRLSAAQGRAQPVSAATTHSPSSAFFPNAPSTRSPTAPVPLPGPRPYFGQALGATYYNWGYFGARQHFQYWRHTGYYNDYHEGGAKRGY